MIQLTYSGASIALPDDLYWADESTWQPVAQAVERTITGALVVQVHARTGGRPITLEPPGDDGAWMTRADLDALLAWAAVPGREMTLTLRGVDHQVVWRHQDAPAIQARPVVPFSDVAPGDFYVVTLKFMEL